MKVLLAVSLLLGPAIVLAGAPAKAAPTGKTWTLEISAAGALVLYAIEYQVAIKRAKGSVAQAQTVMTADLSALAYPSPGPTSIKSLSDLKSAVSAQAGSRTLDAQYRTHFEDFRSCYNQVVIGGVASPSPSPGASASPSPSPSASKTSAPSQHRRPSPKPHPTKTPHSKQPHGSRDSMSVVGSASPTRSPKPHPSPSPIPKASPSPSSSPKATSGCEALLSDFAPSPQPSVTPAQEGLVSPIDLIDLTESLKSAPSLMQQVQGQDVGSYGPDDAIRGAFLIAMGARLLAEPPPIPKLSGPPQVAGLTEAEDIEKACISQASPFACIGAIGSVETALAQSKQQKIACDWATGAWLPTYSQIRLHAIYTATASPSPSLKTLDNLMQQSKPPGC